MAINTTETVKAKIIFDREAQSKGVSIKGSFTDNGVSNYESFMDLLFSKGLLLNHFSVI